MERSIKETNALKVVGILSSDKTLEFIKSSNSYKSMIATLGSLVVMVIIGIVFSPFYFGFLSVNGPVFIGLLSIFIANKIDRSFRMFPYTNKEMTDKKADTIAMAYIISKYPIRARIIPIIPVLYLLFINSMFIMFSILIAAAVLEMITAVMGKRYARQAIDWIGKKHDNGEYE